MDLLEYQVKEWFSQIGIPVLPSQRIDHPTDLKRLKISYPIVLKSQVYAPCRAKAGGVRTAETTIDAIAAAQTIFSSPILGELPQVLLAESKYDTHQEFSLAVVLDTTVCRPVILGGQEVDINWESAGEKMEYVVVEQEFSPFYARRLALKMGLQGKLMQSVSNVIEKMYQLFVQKDLDLVEISPLAVNASGQVMALNGKVKVNERAINRHPEISEMATKIVPRHPLSQINSISGSWDEEGITGKIGVLGNGAGSVLTTLDLVAKAQGRLGLCLNLRHSFLTDTSATTFCDRLETGLKIITADRKIQVLLINFLGTIPQMDQMPEVIARFIYQKRNELKSRRLLTNGTRNQREPNGPHLVVRLAGSDFSTTRKSLAALATPDQRLIVVENLDEAVAAAVNLAEL